LNNGPAICNPLLVESLIDALNDAFAAANEARDTATVAANSGCVPCFMDALNTLLPLLDTIDSLLDRLEVEINCFNVLPVRLSPVPDPYFERDAHPSPMWALLHRSHYLMISA
jgi:hypothetical protein